MSYDVLHAWSVAAVSTSFFFLKKINCLWRVVVHSASPEDCQILAQLLDSATDGEGLAQTIDVPKVLETYNERRLEDAQAVCTLSEIGMGGSRSMRPAFAMQMLLMVILNKTLGRLAPKVNTFISRRCFACGLM